MDHYKLFINGEFMDAASGETFESIDPGTSTPIAIVARAGKADAEAAIAAARTAFDSGVWSGMSVSKRMAIMQSFSEELSKQNMRLAVTEAMDSGQTIGFAAGGVMANTMTIRNISLLAATKFPWEEAITVSGSWSAGREYIRREPIGVCVGIVPWNVPMTAAIEKITPAMIMGNTIVLKPASDTPLSALIMAECAKAAGIPNGVLNVITGPGGELGKVLCTHPDVDKIAFTGSTEVGREIMKMAADTIKRVTLELGGKSANIILDDADIDLAVEAACFGTFFHQGQICISGTRVLVSKKIYDEFVERFRKRAEALRVGYQLNPNSHLGPLISKKQLATVAKYVKIGKDEGAELITGGKRVEVPGFNGNYYAPTIFANVNNKMRIAQEEIFGPVVCVIKYDTDEEAIAIANDSIYGLAGAVFSSNIARAERIAREVKTGTMFINNYHALADYCPFGGYKQSGVGLEHGLEGLKGYTNTKHVHIAASTSAKSNMAFQMLSDYRGLDSFAFNIQTLVKVGHGALALLNKAVFDLGCRRALIITDAGVRGAGLADLVKNTLSDLCVGIYDKVPPDPDLESVDAATTFARELKADCIVSVGGGSVIDCAKGVCVTLKNGGTIREHVNIMLLAEPQIPHISIPTTSGTGSEVSYASVLTNHQLGRKTTLADPRIQPNVAILDPIFAMSMPKDITVSTGMDALTHAVEALTSTLANIISDGNALQSIRLISENFPLVVADGKNEKARSNMQVAATLAGFAFSGAGLGVAHAIAHSLGTMYHLPHGKACGLALPKVMRYNVDYATDKYVQAAIAMGVSRDGKTERELALSAADAVESLMKQVGQPTRLRDVGIPKEGLDMCGFHALADINGMVNPRPIKDPTELIELLNEMY